MSITSDEQSDTSLYRYIGMIFIGQEGKQYFIQLDVELSEVVLLYEIRGRHKLVLNTYENENKIELINTFEQESDLDEYDNPLFDNVYATFYFADDNSDVFLPITRDYLEDIIEIIYGQYDDLPNINQIISRLTINTGCATLENIDLLKISVMPDEEGVIALIIFDPDDLSNYSEESFDRFRYVWR